VSGDFKIKRRGFSGCIKATHGESTGRTRKRKFKKPEQVGGGGAPNKGYQRLRSETLWFKVQSRGSPARERKCKKKQTATDPFWGGAKKHRSGKKGKNKEGETGGRGDILKGPQGKKIDYRYTKGERTKKTRLIHKG